MRPQPTIQRQYRPIHLSRTTPTAQPWRWGSIFPFARCFPGKSLDDWMRAMWREHPDFRISRTHSTDLQKTLASVTPAKSSRAIFSRATSTVWNRWTMPACWRTPASCCKPHRPAKPWIGTPPMSFSDRGADVTGPTLRGSPLYLAGIDRGDRIVEIDGKKLKTGGMGRSGGVAQARGPQHADRGGPRRKEAGRDHLGAGPGRRDRFLREDRTASDSRDRRRSAKSWLGSKALRPLPRID